MIIKEVNIKNFRRQGRFLALRGAYGPGRAKRGGKSSFLKAIELFYSAAPKFAVEDFYDCDPTADIEIAITFTALTTNEAGLFANYLEGPDLTIVRVLSLSSGKARRSTTALLFRTRSSSQFERPARRRRRKPLTKICGAVRNTPLCRNGPNRTTQLRFSSSGRYKSERM